ncbi:MAG: hypothetical protein Roseis2KO_15920 [Roseivirga sp.]
MRYTLILFGSILLITTACSEDEGFDSNLTKTVEIDFELDTNTILNNDGVISFAKQHDVMANDFLEYIGRVKDVEIQRAELSVSGFGEATSLTSFVKQADFKLRSTAEEPEILDFFSLENLPLSGSLSMVLYEQDSTSSQEMQSAIEFVRRQILLDQPFIWDIDGNLEAIPPNKLLIIKVFIDVTATVEIL